MNRNLFERPDQGGGRSSPDYGRSDIPPPGPQWSRRIEVALTMLIFLVLIIWIAAR